MATVTRVGSTLPQSSTGVGTPKSQAGAWGTGQDRAAGDLLVALVTASGSTSAGATSQTSGTTGWTKLVEFGGTLVKAAIWTKTAAGSDAAPSFDSTIAGTAARCHMSVTLYQLHGDNGLTPVADTQNSSGAGTSGTLTITTAANVAAANEVGLAIQCCQGSTAAGNTWGFSGSWTPDGADAGGSTYFHWVEVYQDNPASGATSSYAPTHTFTSTGTAGALAIFKPGTLLVNNAEGGTNGSTVTTANAGGASNTQFNAVSGTAPQPTFDNAQVAHGSLSFKSANSGTNGQRYLQWTGVVTVRTWFRIELYYTANPTTWGSYPAEIGNASIKVLTNGMISICTGDHVSGIVADVTTTTAIPLNQWFRVEGYVDNGACEIKLFTGVDDVTPADTKTKASAAQNYLTASNARWGGRLSTVDPNVNDFWFDDVGVSTNGYLGPAIPVATIDAVGPAGGAGIHSSSSPITWAHVNSNAANAIFVGFTWSSGGSNPVTAVTYGGVTLPLLDSQLSAGGNGGTALYGKAGSLPTGSNTVSVTFTTGFGDALTGSISLINAGSIGTPVKFSNPTSGNSSVSVSVPGTASGGMIVAVAGYGGGGGGGTFSGTNGVTVRISDVVSAASSMDNQVAGTVASTGGGASQTVGFSESAGADWWTIVAAEALTSAEVSSATGAVSLKKMKVAASSIGFSDATGAPKLKKMTVAGSGPGGLTLPYRDTIIADAPSVYYRLGESAGATAAVPDAGAGGVNASQVGTVTFGQTGALTGDSDKAVSFPGTGTSYLQTASSPGTAYDLGNGPFSIEFWYKIAASGVAHNMVSKGGNAYLARLLATNKWSLRMGTTGSNFTTTATFADTASWHHVVMTWDGATAHIYVDGTDQAGTSTITAFVDTTTGFSIGVDNVNKTAGPTNGLIDEVALYKTVLSQVKVTAHYQAGTAAAPEVSSVTGAVSMKKMTVAASGIGFADVSAGPKLKKMTVAGSGIGFADISGGPRLKKMTVAGAGTTISIVTSAVSLKKMKVAGSGIGFADVSGAPRLKKMTVAGSGAGFADISGGPKLKKMTVAGTGTTISIATSAVSLKKMKVAGSVIGFSDVTGAVRLKKMTVSGAGTKVSTATSAVSLKKMAVAGSGAGFADISGGPRLKKMTVAGAGTKVSTATAAVSLKKMKVAGLVTGFSDITGAVKLKKMTVAGSGIGFSDATGLVRLKKMTVSGAGTKVSTATAAVSLKKMKVAGSGAGFADVTGAVKLKKMTLAGSVTGFSDATGAVKLKKMTIAGSGVPPPEISDGTGAISLKKMTVAGSGAGIAVLSGGPLFKKMTVSGAGAGITVASGGPRLKKMVVSSAGEGVTIFSGGPGLKKMRIAGSGAGISVATGGPALKKMRVSGSGAGISVASGGPALKKMSVTVTGTTISVVTGAVRMKKMTVLGIEGEISLISGIISMKKPGILGTGAGFADISGGPGLKKMRVAGAGAGITVVTGVIGLKKMTVSGISAGLTIVSGDILLHKMVITGTGEGITVGTIVVGMKKMRIRGESVKIVVADNMLIFSLL